MTEEEPEAQEVERRPKVSSPSWTGQVRNAGEPQEKSSLGGIGLGTILPLLARNQVALPPFYSLTRFRLSSPGLELGSKAGLLRSQGPPQYKEPRTGRKEARVPVPTGAVTSGQGITCHLSLGSTELVLQTSR